jgi:hypothetical protein
MAFSDTLVIYRLANYFVTMSPDTNITSLPYTNNSMLPDTDTNTTISPDINSQLTNSSDVETFSIEWTLWGLWAFLILVYVYSLWGMLRTPFLSSLRLSFQTGLSMMETTPEKADTATPLGKNINENHLLAVMILTFLP